MCTFPSCGTLKAYFFLFVLALITIAMICIWGALEEKVFIRSLLFIVFLPVIIIWIYKKLLMLGSASSDKLKAAEVTSVITLLLFSIITLYYVHHEQKLSTEFKRFEHYNYYNKLYAEWYAKLPKTILDKNKLYNDLTKGEKAFIRTYFNLYTQEYYMYKKGMIPQEMWEFVIHGNEGNCDTGAMINLREYPILIEGYKDWKAKGAFSYPQNFRTMLDAKLSECGLLK